MKVCAWFCGLAAAGVRVAGSAGVQGRRAAAQMLRGERAP